MRSNAVGVRGRTPTATRQGRMVCLWPPRARGLVAGRGIAHVRRMCVATSHAEKSEQAEKSEPSSLRASATITVVILSLRVTQIAIAGARCRTRARLTSSGSCGGSRLRRARGARLRVDHCYGRSRAHQHEASTSRHLLHVRLHEHLLPLSVDRAAPTAASRGARQAGVMPLETFVAVSPSRRLCLLFPHLGCGTGLENRVGDVVAARRAHRLRDTATQLVLTGEQRFAAGAKAATRFDDE
jgi:hypothetical protein